MTTNGELPRLIRYVEDGAMPGNDLVAILDPDQNLLIINRDLFDRLNDQDKKQVWRTHETSLTVDLRDYSLN